MIHHKVRVPTPLALAVAVTLVLSTIAGASIHEIRDPDTAQVSDLTAPAEVAAVAAPAKKPAIKRPRIKLDLLMLRRG